MTMELLHTNYHKVILEKSARSIKGNKRTECYHLVWQHTVESGLAGLVRVTPVFELNSKPCLSCKLSNEMSTDGVDDFLMFKLTVDTVDVLRKGSVYFYYYKENCSWRGKSGCPVYLGNHGEFGRSESTFIPLESDGKVNRRYLSQGKLIIKCEVILESEVNPFNQTGDFYVLSKLLKDSDFSDVDIKIGDNIIPAHKCILSAWSPVFRAMLTVDMKESKENQITITDFEPQVIEALFKFMYTGELTDITYFAQDLMRASDKYQLDKSTLFAICEEILGIGLTVANVCSTLAVADLYQADNLRWEATAYALTNIEAVTKTEGWQSLKESRPAIVISLMESIEGVCKPKKLKAK